MSTPTLLPVQEHTLGLLVIPDEVNSALPLEHTSVAVQIIGGLATVTVTQQFGNPLDQKAELEYIFPLPHEASITGFVFSVAGRLIEGVLREHKQARQEYEQAQAEGRQAGLLEQRRPNLFAVRLANVLPGQTVQATIRYSQKLKYDSGEYEFVFPMGVTPRYDSPGHPEEGQGIHPPVAVPGEQIGTVEIQLSADSAIKAGEPVSPSHPIEVTHIDDRRFQARLAGEHIPDHDFVLRYAANQETVGGAAWTSVEKDGEVILVTLITPIQTEMDPTPREFVFVLDRSGSMMGDPIAQARNALRACLRTLNPADTFRILLFDNEIEWYRQESSQVTQAEVEKADAFLSKVEGRGGTEIMGALQAVLALPADPERTRYVVFLTDGAVSAEERALQAIRQQLGKTRIFTFGIGPAVNRALLSQMARYGRGVAEFLQLDEDIEGAILRFQDRVSFPVLTNLAIEWQGARVWDVLPSIPPDLYAGQPLELCGRIQPTGNDPARLVVRGLAGSEKVELTLSLPPAQSPEPIVSRAWARARVAELLDQEYESIHNAEQIRNQVISVAMQYNLVTKYTSFVAIDREITAEPGKGKIIRVAQPLPAGLDRAGFGLTRNMMSNMAYPQFITPTPTMPASLRSRRLMQQGDIMDKSDFALPDYPANLHPTVSAGFPIPQQAQGDILRQLVRSQDLDGSWGSNGELTAAALLAFVRQGNTTRRGMFRKAVKKAFAWLEQAQLTGYAPFSRALAFSELAAADDRPAFQAVAAQVAGALPAPATPLEQAAWDVIHSGAAPGLPTPAEIASLDDARLAALLNTRLPLTQGFERSSDAWLATVWAGV